MKKNMGSVDKIIRLLVAALVATLVYAELITGVLAIVLLALALIFLVTSLVNFCPIYALFGWSTCRTNTTKNR